MTSKDFVRRREPTTFRDRKMFDLGLPLFSIRRLNFRDVKQQVISGCALPAAIAAMARACEKQVRQSITEQVPIIFCVGCGSTHVDQNSINELRCYNCGNRLDWDARRFSISRNKDLRDVVTAIKNCKRR